MLKHQPALSGIERLAEYAITYYLEKRLLEQPGQSLEDSLNVS